jgi:hypothetical protein
VRQLLKRNLIWAIPLEFVVLLLALVRDEVRLTTQTDPIHMRLAQWLHFPAVPYGPQGNALIVVLNGYLAVTLILVLLSLLYRMIARWVVSASYRVAR